MSILEVGLTPEMEQGLRVLAQRQGMELKAYVEALLIQDLQEDEDVGLDGGIRNERSQ